MLDKFPPINPDEPHYRVCNYCEAMCGLKIEYDPTAETPESIFKVRADKDDTFSHGSMCPKASALGAIHLDPDRLKYPVKKVMDQDGNVEWQTIDWEEAYSLFENKFKSILSSHGKNAIATYLGNPIVHNLGMMVTVKMLTQSIGSQNVFSATSMDQLPHHFAAHFMFGHEFRIPVPDIDHTDYMIIMGANPMASNGSIMTSAGVSKRLNEIKKRGGKLIVIDPRKTETGKIANEHYFIKPATDLYFLLSFLHVLFRDDHIKLGSLEPHLKDFDQLKPLINEFSPDQVTLITGIPAADTERLVAEYTASDKAILYGRMGLSTQAHGGLCHWLINTINIVSGHFDTAGGMMFPKPAIDLARSTQKASFGRWKSRVRNLSEFAGELPVSTMADELLTPGEGQVRGFLTICGNPVLSSPGGHRLDKALADIEFMVSIDNYINETTRHADLILPTPTGLEIDHYDLIFNTISVNNNAKFSQAMVPVAEDRPYDWQVVKELAARMAPKGLKLVDRLMTPKRLLNLGMMMGAYGKLSSPHRWLNGLSLKKVIQAKHGVPLGSLQSWVPSGLKTPDKKIHLAPDVFVERLRSVSENEYRNRLAELASTDMSLTSFALIGRRNVYTNNSWMHQVPNLNKSKQVRCTAMLNPNDAQGLELQNGDIIKVSSRVGEIEIPVEVTDTMMPGVVSIPHGFGHNKKGTKVRVAESKPGVSVNDITDPLHIDELTGNAAFSNLPVEIIKISENSTANIEAGKPLTILYGSQSGNAEMLAFDAQALASNYEMLPELIDMNDVNFESIQKTERLLVIISTFGEGELPDSAELLWKQLQESSTDALTNTHYAVLGLGDRSYEDFCQAGIDFDSQLETLGAQRLTPLAKCGVDYADDAEQWLHSTLEAIGVKGNQEKVEASAEHQLNAKKAGSVFNRAKPMSMVLSKKYRLNSEQSDKQTMHYELEFTDQVQYTPGDSLYIIPKNNPILVQRWLDFMSLSSDEPLPGYDEGTTALKVLSDTLEIRLPSEKTLNFLAKHCPDVIKEFNENSTATLASNSNDLLELIDACNLTVEHYTDLIATLPSIIPRAYSISSSPSQTPNTVALTVATVRYGDQKQHQGVASVYLTDFLQEGEVIGGYFVGSKHFSLPEDTNAPVIMIGPGTGIAPFRSFLLERKELKHEGENWLFFGDRNVENDFLYRAELEQLQEEGFLTHLDLAFSRDQTEKIYVQDRMLEKSKTLFDWLERGAYLYVCGDAKQMAVSVDQALHQIVIQEGNLSDQQSKEYIANLATTNRYVKDVY